MAILKERWVGEKIEDEMKTTYQYVFDLRNKLEDTCKVVHEELKQASQRYKRYYDAKTRNRQLEVGDQALLLLPTEGNKLMMQWKGPYEVVEKKCDADYVIDLGHARKLFHANILKKYEQRAASTAGDASTSFASVAYEPENSEDGVDVEPPFALGRCREDHRDVIIGKDPTKQQRSGLVKLMESYREIFSDLPGSTNLVECQLETSSDNPVHVKQYPLPLAVKEEVEKEVQAMLDIGVIERSNSPYHSPLLIVRKPDGTNRVCIDFRKLNAIVISDAEPIPRTDCLLAEIGTRSYFTKLDLAKGYWQIPIGDQSKVKTAFSSPSGLYQFK